MHLAQIEGTMAGLGDVANAGSRQAKRIRDILKLMQISVAEHNGMMAVPEYVNNYIAFLGQDGLDTAIATSAKFEIILKEFEESGLVDEVYLTSLVNS